jgi:hypothetical protein
MGRDAHPASRFRKEPQMYAQMTPEELAEVAAFHEAFANFAIAMWALVS